MSEWYTCPVNVLPSKKPHLSSEKQGLDIQFMAISVRGYFLKYHFQVENAKNMLTASLS